MKVKTMLHIIYMNCHEDKHYRNNRIENIMKLYGYSLYRNGVLIDTYEVIQKVLCIVEDILNKKECCNSRLEINNLISAIVGNYYAGFFKSCFLEESTIEYS